MAYLHLLRVFLLHYLAARIDSVDNPAYESDLEVWGTSGFFLSYLQHDGESPQ